MFVYAAKSKLDALQSKEISSSNTSSSSSSSTSTVTAAKASTTKNGANKASSSKSVNGGRKSRKLNGETSPVSDPEPVLNGEASGLEILPSHLRRLIEEDLSERKDEIEKHAADQVSVCCKESWISVRLQITMGQATVKHGQVCWPAQ